MTIASDHSIRHFLSIGELVVSDLEDHQIQPASIDLTLGEGFMGSNGVQERHLGGGGSFWLQPKQFVLATTKQRVKLGRQICARVEGRSSIGRKGVMVHATAGFIDPGFDGNITLEIYNLSDEEFVLYPGSSICQLAIEILSTPCLRAYGDPELKSKYQGQSGVTASRSELAKNYMDLAKNYTSSFQFNNEHTELLAGTRVYHRRADLFGEFERRVAVDITKAYVKYEWPYDQAAPPVEVPISELVPDYLAPNGG